ncbi:MAG: hypothetical protein ACJA19_000909 [Bacteroidia bacterium]|jgi:hypothetical protein
MPRYSISIIDERILERLTRWIRLRFYCFFFDERLHSVCYEGISQIKFQGLRTLKIFWNDI